jgi:hypothetical protein
MIVEIVWLSLIVGQQVNQLQLEGKLARYFYYRGRLMSRRLVILFSGLLLFVLAGATFATAQDFATDLKKQCDEVCQPTEQPWRKIPWQTDLLVAQKLAVEQAKPIFIWAMDGHPLGCT